MTATFTRRPTPHSLRQQILMDAQAKLDIGLRIKELRDNGPETNRSIAEYVGVGERSVAAWLAGGGISYDNAKKVAELFQVDADFIWRGRPKAETPDLLGALSPATERAELKQVAEKTEDLCRLVEKVLENEALLLAGQAAVRDELQALREGQQRLGRSLGDASNG